MALPVNLAKIHSTHFEYRVALERTNFCTFFGLSSNVIIDKTSAGRWTEIDSAGNKGWPASHGRIKLEKLNLITG